MSVASIQPIGFSTRRAALPEPTPIRWTIKEFHNLGDSGIFEGRRAMLIDGVIVEQGPMNPDHAEGIEVIDGVIRELFGKGWRVRNHLPLITGKATDPHPDFAIIKGEFKPTRRHPTAAVLVIEVADSSRRFDMTVKAKLYASARIPEYWVVDVIRRELTVHRDPEADDYKTKFTLLPKDKIVPLALPQRTLAVKKLFA